jgi:hypothetical protein
MPGETFSQLPSLVGLLSPIFVSALALPLCKPSAAALLFILTDGPSLTYFSLPLPQSSVDCSALAFASVASSSNSFFSASSDSLNSSSSIRDLISGFLSNRSFPKYLSEDVKLY